MNRPIAGDARVTIVMTARERHGLAEAAISSVIAGTRVPYRLLYVDVCGPAWLRETLAKLAAERKLEVVLIDEPLWPQEARMRVLDAIHTDFVVFIDNDIEVAPGWLEALIACADDTGAGIVGPLYLWGDGVSSPTIHMAGGRLTETLQPQGRALEEAHQLVDMDPQRVEAQLTRRPCDFVEFHCMLVRTSLVRRGVLDPAMKCVHEHIDTSLAAKALGEATYFEPGARVTYLAFSDYMLDDLALFRARWSGEQANEDIGRFCAKWQVVDDARSFGPVREFVRKHVADVDPLRVASRSDGSLHETLAPAAFVQTRSGLLDLAMARGYERDEIALIANACHLAHVLLDGGYRPCGRPFVNHLIGTAGVLVRYDFAATTVAAGLLHAAYTHCPPHAGGAEAGVDAVATVLGGRGSPIERRVRDYTLRDTAGSDAPDIDASALSIREAEILAITAANELDMHLSGEFRYSGRSDAMRADVIAKLQPVCEALGVPGLHRSLDAAQRSANPIVPKAFLSPVPYSYRIGPDRRSAMPLVNPQAIEIVRSAPIAIGRAA